MAWVSAYFGVTLFVALLCFVLAESVNPASREAGSSIAVVALTGLMWPMLIIGLGLLLIVVVLSRLGRLGDLQRARHHS